MPWSTPPAPRTAAECKNLSSRLGTGLWLFAVAVSLRHGPTSRLCGMGYRASRGSHSVITSHRNDRLLEHQRKAKDLMATRSTGRLTPEASAELENAVAHDMGMTDHQVANREARLNKVEAQVQALSEAVVAIAEPSDTWTMPCRR